MSSATDEKNAGDQVASIADLEAEIAERRAHLGTTIDELVTRLSPRALLRREVDGARIKVAEVTRTPDGALRTELIAGVLAGAAALFIGAGLVKRARG